MAQQLLIGATLGVNMAFRSRVKAMFALSFPLSCKDEMIAEQICHSVQITGYQLLNC